MYLSSSWRRSGSLDLLSLKSLFFVACAARWSIEKYLQTFLNNTKQAQIVTSVLCGRNSRTKTGPIIKWPPRRLLFTRLKSSVLTFHCTSNERYSQISVQSAWRIILPWHSNFPQTFFSFALCEVAGDSLVEILFWGCLPAYILFVCVCTCHNQNLSVQGVVMQLALY